MKEQSDPLVMYVHDGSKLRIDPELNLTLNGEEPTPEEVVEFLLVFAEDAMKAPQEPSEALIALVKETIIKEEQEKKNGD